MICHAAGEMGASLERFRKGSSRRARLKAVQWKMERSIWLEASLHTCSRDSSIVVTRGFLFHLLHFLFYSSLSSTWLIFS
ncbi:hypothetical protein BDW69DRAFT_159515 [Aspergillus filifer]